MFSSAIKTGVANHRSYFVGPAYAKWRLSPLPKAGLYRRNSRKKLFSGQFRRFGFIDLLELPGNRLAWLPVAEAQRIADQVHNAGLNFGVGKTAVMASGKPLSLSMTAMRMSCRPRFFSAARTLKRRFSEACAGHLIHLQIKLRKGSDYGIRRFRLPIPICVFA